MSTFRNPSSRQLVVDEWGRRAAAEYQSAVIAHEVTLGLLRLGAPPDLVRDGLRIVDDELRHSELSIAVASEAAGHDVLPSIVLEVLPGLSSADPAGAVRSAVGRFFCVGETAAVPLFRMLRSHTTVEPARGALDVILGDEARHRRFGWDVLDWLISIDAPTVVDALSAALPELIEGIRSAYADDGSVPPPDDDARRWGLAASSEYVPVVARAVADDVLPRFSARGIGPRS